MWLEESWEPYLFEELDEDMGACLTTLSFFTSRSIAENIVKESGRPEGSLATFAAKFHEVFPEAVTGYAQIGMVIRKAVRQADKAARESDDSISSVGRNAPCPCGSGKKYKRCCGAA